MENDVLIIGGGVIGLTIARELHQRGVRKITILERGSIGSEASWAAAGMLAPNIEAPTDGPFHQFCVDALERFPDLADDLLDETGIDIELDRSGTISIGFGADDDLELDRHVARGFQRLSPPDLRELEPAIAEDVTSGVLFPNDWQVENRKLLTSLRRSVNARGIRIVEDAEVFGLLTNGPNVVGVESSRGEFSAAVTVLATGAWTSLIKIGGVPIPVMVSPIRGQMISFDTPERRISRVVFSRRGYLVPRVDGRVLVGATVEDVGFDKQTPPEGGEGLRRAAIEIAPYLRDLEIRDHWAGLRPFAPDSLPVLGEVPGYENILVATAHYRNGILLAPITAAITAELIIGSSHSEYFDSFGIGRFTAAANASVVS